MDVPALRLGVDLGGTKTEAVVIELDGAWARPIQHEDESRFAESKARGFPPMPRELARKRVATNRELGYEHILSNTEKLIRTVAREAGLGELPLVGIGMPGGITQDGLVKNSNTLCLNGQPFRRDLADKLGVAVQFENDANCFALAEATFGAGRGKDVVFGVILGTGVGGGLVIRGSLWPGQAGLAGEFGHLSLEPRDGPACYCGRRGCVETFLSGPALESRYHSLSGVHLSLVEIGGRRSTDSFAQEVLDSALDHFGRTLASVVHIVDPSIFVLGGGVSNLKTWCDEGPVHVTKWLFDDSFKTPVVMNQLGDSAGVLGAALL